MSTHPTTAVDAAAKVLLAQQCSPSLGVVADWYGITEEARARLRRDAAEVLAAAHPMFPQMVTAIEQLTATNAAVLAAVQQAEHEALNHRYPIEPEETCSRVRAALGVPGVGDGCPQCESAATRWQTQRGTPAPWATTTE